mmetsp:Transcript_17029/g.28776  ORF Transcript_17029/g.28776 Transcript_17029/m.28776 type:complete len:101 (+) Transcript_17029:3-305(+)
MPEKDGLQASKEIIEMMKGVNEYGPNASQQFDRKGVNEDGDLCHIVSLTSYTNKGPECKSIGIKNCLNKPLVVKVLREIMLRHFFRDDESIVQQKMELWR